VSTGTGTSPKFAADLARQGHELIQDFRLLHRWRAAVACSQCFDQFFACCHADSPRHVVLLPSDHPTGSKLREVTGQLG
jgi:hypothetical protein